MTDDCTDTRRRSFDANAPLYGQMRPGYPPALVDDAIVLTAIPEDGRILEIGCGAGQATEAFASRGVKMLSLDIGAELVAQARARIGDSGNVEFIVTSFEDFAPAARRFHIVLAAW